MSDDGKVFDLTDDEAERILIGVLRHAGPDGLGREEAHRRFEIVAEEIVNLKIAAGLLRAFSEGSLEPGVNSDDEVVWRSE